MRRASCAHAGKSCAADSAKLLVCASYKYTRQHVVFSWTRRALAPGCNVAGVAAHQVEKVYNRRFKHLRRARVVRRNGPGHGRVPCPGNGRNRAPERRRYEVRKRELLIKYLRARLLRPIAKSSGFPDCWCRYDELLRNSVV